MKDAHSAAETLENFVAQTRAQARELGALVAGNVTRHRVAIMLSGSLAVGGCTSYSEVVLGPMPSQTTEASEDVEQPIVVVEETEEPTVTTTEEPLTAEEALERTNEELEERYDSCGPNAATEYNKSEERNGYLYEQLQYFAGIIVDKVEARDDPRVQAEFYNPSTKFQGFGSENVGRGVMRVSFDMNGVSHWAEMEAYLGTETTDYGSQAIDLDEGMGYLSVEYNDPRAPMRGRVETADSIKNRWGIEIPDGSLSASYLQMSSTAGDLNQMHEEYYVDGLVACEMSVEEIKEIDALTVDAFNRFVIELNLVDAPLAQHNESPDK